MIVTEALCSLDDLPDAAPKLFKTGNRQIAIVRIGAEAYAIDAWCPHWNGPLGEGKVSAARREIECPWHRFRFSLTDGACVATNNRPPATTFPVRIENGNVFVEIPAS